MSLLESRAHQPSLETLKGLADGLGMSPSAFTVEIEDVLAVRR